MPTDSFNTISDDLLHIAAAAEVFYEDQGYAVEIEKRRLEFPFTPALVATMEHETVIVEVCDAIDEERVERWIRYSRSQASDTRFCLVVRRQGGVNGEEIAYANDNRIGLIIHDDVNCVTVRPPSDLAVAVALPEIKQLSPKLRPMLAAAFRKFDTDWRDGLGEAFNEVEQQAREYLKLGINSGRIVIAKKNGNLTALEVDSMTPGQLKKQFKLIQKQNYTDSMILSTLSIILENRNGLTHKKKSKEVEEKLRRQAGGQMYVIMSCLEEMNK